MSLRRSKSSKTGDGGGNGHTPLTNGSAAGHHDEHSDADAHSHSHSHSIFSSHSHGEEGHLQGHEKIIEALRGGGKTGDKGSRITLIGLFSNVGLTLAKGAAGWYMHSASLLADAGHSMSDLLGDFVVLFCWKLSRKPPSRRYPYGFAKYESLGTTTVSILLIGGALGLGFHSYHILMEALSHTASALNAGPLQTTLQNVTATAQHVPSIQLGHAHEADVLDPNAAWFAAIGVIAKEWLYRITKKVADEEKSPVLLANAIHHRSDAYSCAVALFAILGTWWFPALPLDPLGGLVVSIVILVQGCSLFAGAFGDLTDAGVSSRTHRALKRVLDRLTVQISLLSISHLRAKRAGSLMFVDLTADVPASLTVRETSELEAKITSTLKEARREIAEVRVQFNPVDEKATEDLDR
ncbi:hypothetical protein PILCRDRAFT_79410 [Piloderma croceum F 1598]|uniref:Uncharacterized protein n=1 Tax=Piloderma croceum (strain F 1598) TaxID=765440 RepID=A0A0C3AMK5_PILCF|nr:hypothetical protein PILCRDRAFT_79410 [Piloderma croceum F 1598]